MGVINHTVGLGAIAGGALSAAFSAHAYAPQTFDFLLGAGDYYPLQSVDFLSGLTSTLATIDPLLLGITAVGLMYVGRSIMNSDHSPSHS